MLSAKTEESDKVIGLSMGADDYVTKPYNTAELMARVKSQLRRYFSLGAANGTTQSQDILKNGGLLLNRNTKELLVDGESVRLTATEYKIMELLMEHPGYVFSAEEIYSQVWQEDAYSVENTVMVHIRRIREKIEIAPKNPKYLKVVWGIGYKIEKIFVSNSPHHLYISWLLRINLHLFPDMTDMYCHRIIHPDCILVPDIFIYLINGKYLSLILHQQ